MKFHRDYETRSWVDLKKFGSWRYMRHPTTDIWCASYAVDNEPVKLWLPGDPVPAEYEEAAMMGAETWAHNCAFEIEVEKHIAAPRYGFPEFELEQQRCTMAGALAMSLPASLDMLAPAVGIEQGKDNVGHRIMKQVAKPRKVIYADGWSDIPWTAVRVQEMDDDGWEVYETPQGQMVAKIRWWNIEDKLEKLYAYCLQDTEVERNADNRLRPLKDTELKLWHLDQKINRRGVKVDLELCHKARSIVKEAEADLNRQCRELTNNEVSKLSNRNQLLQWVRDQGLMTDSLAKDVLEQIIEDGIENRMAEHEAEVADDPEWALWRELNQDNRKDRAQRVSRIIELRRQAARASVAKIDALIFGADHEDGRIRGLLQFHAASTGRWGGRRFQPQNIKRPDEKDIDTLIEIILSGDYDYISMCYPDVLSAVSDALRGMLIADEGKEILAADYSNIEGRDLSWLAGEKWKLKAFSEFDRGIGHDLYKVAAGGILSKPPGDITKDERQDIGKVSELAFGYQGGVGAWMNFAKGEAAEFSVDKINGYKDAWREKHEATTNFWRDMEDAAMSAVMQPGSTQRVLGPYAEIIFRKAGSFLFMQLPSKRFLTYPYPEIRSIKAPWTTKDGKPAYRDALTYMSTIDPSKRGKIVPDKRNRPLWARISTYGGMLAENVTQAVARDVLADAMPRLEAAGYDCILTVHDEFVAERDKGEGSAEDMETIMCDLPEWAKGMPIAAEGFVAERYRK